MILLLLAAGVGIALLLLLALFFIPVVVRVALGRTAGSGRFLFQASWAGIGARVRTAGGESRQEFLLGDRALFTRTAGAGGAPPPDTEGEPREQTGGAPLTRKISCLLELIQPLFGLLRRFLGSLALQEIQGRLTVGSGDPAETGMLFGWYQALRPLLRCSRVDLEVTPAFDRPVLEGEVMATARIERPLLLLFAMARVALDPDVRAALRGLREA